jgi:tRNA-2-methylthio-N6-dimethylallyladenosine synthase
MKTIFVETYGCQMNEYDTELVKAILMKENYAFTKDELKADVVMLNTCAIREHAHRKVFGRIHDIKYKRQGKPVKIGILGCMATNLRKELLDDGKLKIDFIAGPDSYKKLPEMIAQSFETDEKLFDLTLSEFETYSDIYPTRKKGVNAWIAVSRGCNNFCTFCVVPYTRGRERSRSIENVVDEVKRLADDGFKQVTLLGQNVNSYHHNSSDFADLMEAVSRVDGIKRIRFTSPHPKDFPEKLLKTIAENPKICKSIHMPLQSGNSRILNLMDRTYTQEEFLALIDKTRALIPNVALSTDIIVGFSTETEEEFEDTYKVMKQVEFDAAFMFKYSERKGTIASKKYPDDVPEDVKTARIMRLNDLQKDVMLKRNLAHVGQTLEILLEDETSTKSDDFYHGRSEGNKSVIIPKGPYKAGEMLSVRIDHATPHVLRGTPQ